MNWRIREVFLATDTDLLRVFIGAYTTLFGLWMVLPSPPFMANSTVRTLELLMPLPVWAAISIVMGVMRIFSSLTDGLIPPWAYQLNALAFFLYWMFMALWSIGNAPLIPALVPINVLLALFSSVLYLRAGWDHAKLKSRHSG